MTILEKVQAGCKEYTLIEKVGFNHEQGNLFKVMNNMTGEISVKCTGELKDTPDTAYNNYSHRRKYSVSTHGMTGTNFYHQWKQMKSRCVNDTLRMYKNDDIRMYNFNCITDTIVEVITTCNTYTLLTVHLL